jgi:hypothetical protein
MQQKSTESSSTANFTLTASEQSRTITISIVPDPK